MSKFSDLSKNQPPGSVVVPPLAWAPTWEPRPTTDVCIGLRFVSDRDLEDARIESMRACERLYPDFRTNEVTMELFVASFQDRLIRYIVGYGTCDPNDVTKAWELFAAAPEDIVKDALTDTGHQLIFDAWERMRITTSISITAATDADIGLLPELAKRLPTLAARSRPAEQRLRRLLRFVLEELEQVEEPAPVGRVDG